MPANKVLTQDQLAALRRDGFVFAPGFFGQGKMQWITAWTDKVTAWPEEPGRHMVHYEDHLNEPGETYVFRV